MKPPHYQFLQRTALTRHNLFAACAIVHAKDMDVHEYEELMREAMDFSDALLQTEEGVKRKPTWDDLRKILCNDLRLMLRHLENGIPLQPGEIGSDDDDAA